MYVIIIETFEFSGLSRNRCMNNLSVSKSCFLYQSLYFVLWLELQAVLLGCIKFVKANLSSGRYKTDTREENQCH